MRKTDIVEVAARKLAPFMFLFGLYLVAFGAESPGGGFQGGVVIASGIILLALARGVENVEDRFRVEALIAVEGVGFALILLLGLAGVFTGLGFLSDVVGMVPPGGAFGRSPFVFALNLLIGLKVGAGAGLICLHLFREE